VVRGLLVFLCALCACDDDTTSNGGPAPTEAGASGTPAPGVAAWSTCFTPSAEVDTCEKLCAQQGQGCATTCATGTRTASNQQAAALTWDGDGCSCGNPRCPAPDRATGWAERCDVSGFATDGNALPRTSVQCCCQPGASSPEPSACDDLTQGMWIKQPAPTPMCATDGLAGHEELNFEPSQPEGAWAVQWACFEGELVARGASQYELNADGCTGMVFGAFFEVVGDTLTLHAGGERSYKHNADAPKRPGNPALGT
jgi:hypothetical protein